MDKRQYQAGWNAAKMGESFNENESEGWKQGYLSLKKIQYKQSQNPTPPYLGDGKGMQNPYVYKTPKGLQNG